MPDHSNDITIHGYPPACGEEDVEALVLDYLRTDDFPDGWIHPDEISDAGAPDLLLARAAWRLNREVARLSGERERLREALEEMLKLYERHAGWCGYNKDAPGDSIHHTAPSLARAALAFSGRKRHKRRASDGSEAVVIEGSVRGRNAPTTADELDDYDDWLAEEEE